MCQPQFGLEAESKDKAEALVRQVLQNSQKWGVGAAGVGLRKSAGNR